MKYRKGDTVAFAELVKDALEFLYRACDGKPVGDVQGNAEDIAKHTAKVLRVQGIKVTK